MRSTSRSLAWSLLFFLLCVSSALAATITGSVTNNSGSSDARVYVQALRVGWGEANLGVSVPLTSGTAGFTIRGLDDEGVYTFRAFMDVTGTGTPHLTDPVGESGQVTISGGVITAGVADIVLTTPGAQTPQTVDATSVSVSPGAGMVFLHWESPRTEMDLLGADHYRVEWSNDGFANIFGSTTDFVAEGDTALFINGLTDGVIYQFRIVSLAGGNTATSDPLTVTVGVLTGGVNISGTVTWSGLTPADGAPLYLVAANKEMNGVYVTKVAAPTNGVSYTIPGVAPGTYQIYAVIDQNDNGLLDNGDFENGDLLAPVVVVNAVDLNEVAVTIAATPAEFMVSTGHYLNSYGGSDNYSVNLRVNGKNKQLLNVAVSGPQIQTSDLAAHYWNELYLWQNVNIRPVETDSYSFTVEYADGSETVYRPVTAVLDNPPTAVTPANDATNVPNAGFTFTWEAPASGPVAANYSLRLNSTTGQFWWDNWELPGYQTSAPYDGPTLADGSYTWSVNLRDAQGNEVGYQPGNLFTVGTGGGGTGSPIAQVVNNTGGLLYQVKVGGVVFTENLSFCGDGCSTAFYGVPVGSNQVDVQQTSISTPASVGSLGSFVDGNSYAVNIRNVGGYCAELWRRYDTNPTFNADTSKVLISSTCSGTTDTEPPSVPTGVNATAVSANQVNVNWNISTDNVGVTYYQVYRNGQPAGAPAGPTNNIWQDYSVAANTTYSYTVAACDAAGNCSLQSASASVTTPNGGGDPGVTGTMTISGTVSYSGQSGQVYLRVSPWGNNDSGYGTSVWVNGSTGAPVDFTIRGVPADQYATYYLSAFMDTTNSGIRSASNPALQSSFSLSQMSSGLNLSLAAPTPPAPPQLGSQMFFIPGADGTGLIFFDRPEVDNRVMVADSYNLYLGTSPDLTTTTNIDQTISGIKNNEFDATLLKGLTPGATYYAIATTVVAGVESAASPLFSLVAPVLTGGQTVSGTINFSGLDVASLGGGKPAYVILHNSLQEADSRIAMVTVTAASTSFSIANVPNGAYDLYVILDTNDNQYIDLGDIVTTDAEALAVLVDNAPNPVGSVTISAGPVAATAQVEHLDAAASWNQGQAMYCLDLDVEEKTRRPVNVALTSTDAGMTDPIDLALSDWGSFGHFICAPTAPAVGDTYSFAVTYDDATTVTYNASVTAVLDSFATAVSPSGTVVNATMPTFTWSPPQTPPAPFKYSVELQQQVSDPSGGTYSEYLWEAWSIPSTQTSVAYVGEPLTPGTYQWRLTVRDQQENEAVTAATFTVTDGSGTVDSDLDGIVDDSDNCPAEYNPNQEDTYGDLRGDACEPPPTGGGDSDLDGVTDSVDNCPESYNPNQEDTYGDLRGDACEPPPTGDVDSDFDGIPDGSDNCPLDVNPQQEDFDYNGIGDACDNDMDGDSILNVNDNCPYQPNADQADTDTDGIGNVCDATPDGGGGPAMTPITLTGTVSYTGSRTGRVYIYASPWSSGGGDGYGTSVTVNGNGTPVNFEIRGVPATDQYGSYQLRAYMDTTGTGMRHAGDPNGSMQSSQTTGIALNLTDAEPQSAPAPDGVQILPGAGGSALIFYEGPSIQIDNQDVLLAESYDLCLSTSAASTMSNCPKKIAGIKANDDNVVFVTGLTAGAQYYAFMTSTVNGVTSAPSPLSGPVPIAVLPGGVTVSGTVSFPNVTLSASKYIYMVLMDETQPEKARMAAIATTTSSKAFSIGNVPAGSYKLYIILDMNGNNYIDEGDIMNGDAQSTFVTVAGTPVALDPITIASADLHPLAQTTHLDASNNWYPGQESYCVKVGIEDGLTHAVNVALTSGPGFDGVVDIARNQWGEFHLNRCGTTPPNLGDTFNYEATFADASKKNYSATVTAVLDSFAQLVSPIDVAVNENMPHFTWQAPASGAPAQYDYALNLFKRVTDTYGTHDEYIWEAWSIPSGQTAIDYDGEPLSYGQKYAWSVKLRDPDGNETITSAAFTPTYDESQNAVGAISFATANPDFTNTLSVTLNLSANDPQGINGMCLSNVTLTNDTGCATGWQTYATSKSWALATGNGLKTVYAKFKDGNGNVGQPVSAQITLDTVAPAGTIVIDGGAVYTTASTVLLAFTATDAISADQIEMMVSDNSSFTGGQWMPLISDMEVEVPAATTDGTKTAYVKYRDLAGNVSTVYTDTIILDTTAPTGTVSINAGALATGSLSVNLTLTGLGTPKYMRFSNDGTWADESIDWETFALSKTGWPLGGNEGTNTVSIQLKDEAGNISAIYSDTIEYDSTPPTGTVVINDDALYTNITTATLTLTRDSTTTTHLRTRMHNGTTWLAWGLYVPYPASGTLAVTLPLGNGIRQIEVQYKDAIGIESDLLSPITDDITLDTTVPTGSVTLVEGPLTNTVDLNLTLDATDSGVDASGVSKVLVSTSSLFTIGLLTTEMDYDTNLAYSLPLAATTIDGLKTIYVKFKDAAGNFSPAYSKTITLDRLAPTGTVKINAGAVATGSLSVNLTLTGLGIPKYMRFSNDGTWADESTDWETFALSKTDWSLVGNEGTNTVSIQLKDEAGNISAIYSDTIEYDSTPPTGTVVINDDALYTNKTAATLTLTRDSTTTTYLRTRMHNGTTWLAWGAYVPYPSSGTLAVTLPLGNGIRQIEVQYKDAAGIESDLLSPITDDITLDTTVPTGSVTLVEGPLTNTVDLNLTLDATDTGVDASGVSKVLIATNSLFTIGKEELLYEDSLNVSYSLPLPTVDGIKTVYVKYQDAAGNFSPVYSKTITLDRLAPTGTVKINAGAVATGSLSVNLTLTGLGAPKYMRFSNDGTWADESTDWETFALSKTGWSLVGNEGTNTVSIQLKDEAGNISAVYSDTIEYDSTPPTGTVVINSDALYANKTAATLTLTRDSTTTTHLRTRMHNGTTWLAWGAYVAYPSSGTLAVTLPLGNGIRQIEVQYKDAAGIESDLLSPITDDITLDSIVPAGTLVIDQGARFNSVDLNLTLSATDTGVDASGVSKVLIATNSLFTIGKEELLYEDSLNVSYSLPLPTVDGIKTVYVKYQDAAGNFSPVYSKTITLDRIAPTGTIKIAAGAVATKLSTVTLNLTAVGTPTRMQFSNDNATWSGWETYLASKPGWVLDPDDGIRSVYVQLQDAAGNVSTATITDTITVDNSAPDPGAVVINAGSEFARLSAATLTLSGATDLTALKVQYSHNGTTWSVLTTYPLNNTLAVSLPAGSGTKTVYVRYADAVGLVSEMISDTIILDTVAPVLPVGTKVKIDNDNVQAVDYSTTAVGGVLSLPMTVPTPIEATSGVTAILWSATSTGPWTEADWIDGNFNIDYPMAVAPTLTTGVTKTVYVKIKDNANNLSVAYTDTFKVIP